MSTRQPIHLKWLLLQSPILDCRAPSFVDKTSASRQGFRSFSMWKHARASLCARVLIAAKLFVFAFSVRKTAWLNLHTDASVGNDYCP